MTDAVLDDLVQILTGDQPPRVWSLVVSLFGDLAQGEDDTLSTQTVNKILGAIGIKPEATRVALHRLRKEGWLQSQRQGRASLYSLTDMGREATQRATPLIYQKHAHPSGVWLVTHPNGDPVDGIAITPNSTLCETASDEPTHLSLQVPATDGLPQWIMEKYCPEAFAVQTQELASKLRTLKDALPDRSELTAFDIAVIRVLVVHSWRRIALRLPPLPRGLLPKTWAGDQAEALAHGILQDLSALSLTDLAEAVGSGNLQPGPA